MRWLPVRSCAQQRLGNAAKRRVTRAECRIGLHAGGRGGKVDRNAQRACERSSDWPSFYQGRSAPDPAHPTGNTT